jgi:hypothetical protein
LKTSARWFAVAAVFVVAGCARQDWIDRTLVTVDVTGTWSGYIKGTSTGGSREVTFELRQEGPKVTGVVNGIGFHGRELSGPIEGSIAGDRLEFRRPNSTFRGAMTVNGDEMTGQTHGGGWTEEGPLILQRVNSAPSSTKP